MKRLLGWAMFLWFLPQPCFSAPPAVELIEVRKIWDRAPHCAFTDLAFWDNRYVCAFREGRAHVSTDGKIRVLTSPDGETWQSTALVGLADYDLRDAGLSTAPDGRLMLIGGASPRKADEEHAPTGSFVSFSENGAIWSKPLIVSEPGRWLWRATWHGGRAYGVAYSAGSKQRFSSLVASDDGTKFPELVPQLLNDGWPTEAALRFGEDGTLYCLQRRDGKAPLNTAMLGTGKPPYTKWDWKDLGLFFGGPNFMHLPGGNWIAAGRIVTDKGPKTALAWLDVQEKTLKPILEFPSGGDNSYPGLLWRDDTLWMSYYSSHEGKANIYLAKVRLNAATDGVGR